MIINPQTLRGIYVAFNTLFNKAFEAEDPLYKLIATVTNSTTDAETYAWLGDIPGMREWIGDREIQNLTASDYTIKNKDFELTVSVPRNAVEDDKIGLYNPSVQMLGQSAAQHPDKLIFDLLASGFVAKCYDGKPFFSEEHMVGKKKVSNLGKEELSMETYIAARAAMMSFTNAKGEPLGLVPDTLVSRPRWKRRPGTSSSPTSSTGRRTPCRGPRSPSSSPASPGTIRSGICFALPAPSSPSSCSSARPRSSSLSPPRPTRTSS